MRSVLEHGKRACMHRSASLGRRGHVQWRWRPLLCATPCHSNNSSFPYVSPRAENLVYRFSTQNHSAEGPLPVDYSSLLDEREFHKLADELLHHLQERFDELGEECDIDGFDIDYAEGVLTIKLGASCTYVINKQTPNRQIWLSSPVSGPARFDWDTKEQRWIYRRTKAELFGLLEKEVHDLVGESVVLSK
ncbi:hypothetical protein GOP47_0022122 [Adiantum capillus-veneris]|uniref:ferroxidase n=1 Tax=Adiantum capillus-veneris TaxID=13818 RepID=A0A9D4U911_ADICA|nr:hypothetical protein GOP47_0022122 [Adiantum capillus-veneris]